VAHPDGRAVKDVCLRSLACGDCEFASRQGHGCLSLGKCCVLQGRGLYKGPMTRREEFYGVCVFVSK